MISSELKHRLDHVLWIGGSPCSGKTTVSKALSQRFGVRVYNLDDHFDDHARRATPDRTPVLSRLSRATWDEVFVARPLDVQISEEFAFYRDEWMLTIEDLLALPADRPVIAEGTGMLPELVAPILHRQSQAIWMVPSEEFQRAMYPTQRAGFVKWITSQCSDGELAVRNWMDRDAAFARIVASEARDGGLPLMMVDGSMALDETITAVGKHFGVTPGEYTHETQPGD